MKLDCLATNPNENLKYVLINDPDLEFLPDLIKRAVATIKPMKIILFGSRARRDHHRLSDIDLAFEVSTDNIKYWGTFLTEIDDKIQTLLKLDLVLIEQGSKNLLNSITREGITIYEP